MFVVHKSILVHFYKMSPLSCGVAIGPLAGSLSVLFAVVLVEIGNFWHKRVVGVGVREERAD